MSVHLHRASRADVLADALGDLLADPLPDPFASELVVVPAKGMERWLSQRLSHRLGPRAGLGDGVCAGIEFRTPASLLAEVLGTGDADPWAAESLAWPLLRALDASLDEPWAATLAAHLGHGDSSADGELRRGRRLAVARRLARLFASYAVQRPTLVAHWSAGGDGDGAEDGAEGGIPSDLAWQPPLWRRLVAEVDLPDPSVRLAETVQALVERPGDFPLPERLSLFGHTRLPDSEVTLLRALGQRREVHLWLPHPSASLWESLRSEGGRVRRERDESHLAVRHPLLAGLGRDTRELERSVLEAVDHDAALPDPAAPDTLLGWLQADLRANEVSPGRTLRSDDRSVQVHRCHGPARQVDVLREVLVGLLADDPTLEPRDILVMCPDIEHYAPLITAGFGLGDLAGPAAHPAHGMRVMLADRALAETNPLLSVGATLLHLASGRAGASELLDLAHARPVRRKFGFSDDDLQQVTEWVRAAGVRWGFDARHRATYGLGDYVANTWRFGLDRLLSGVALSDDARLWLDKTLPLDDVGSGQADLAGRFAEFVARVEEAVGRLEGEHPLEHWLGALTDGISQLGSAPVTEGWMGGQVAREVGSIREAAGVSTTASLRLSDVRELLADRLGGRPTRASFRTGTLTVCTMVPMRSVPHRVVCLLGLDDGVFPRVGALDGDNLLRRVPLTGERDPRSEDRQLLLDAILAATETLVVTYTGADEHTGALRPPAVPLGELLDSLDLTAAGARRRVVTHHPLQPFAPVNFVPGGLIGDQPFSFDGAGLAGAVRSVQPRVAPPPLLDGPLAPLPESDVSLDELLWFYKHPCRGFLRQRLDVALLDEADEVDDGLPVEIDSLTRWAVGDRVLQDLLAGHTPEEVRQREWRRGVLPPGRLGWRQLGEIVMEAIPIAEHGRSLRTGEPEAVDIDVDLGGGRRVTGTVPSAYSSTLVPVSWSRLAGKARLESWIKVLALSSAHPDRNWTAHTVGKSGSRHRPVGTSILGPVDHRAPELLADLVRIRDLGLQAPLPLTLKASLNYAAQRRTNTPEEQALQRATDYDWADGRFPGECSDTAHIRVFGAGAPLPGLDVAPRAGLEFPGERHEFGAVALRVFGPMLDCEQGSW